MKLKVVLLTMLSTLCGVLAVNNVPAVKADAAETFGEISARVFGGCWDGEKSTSTYTEDGVVVTVPGADTVGEQAWTYSCEAPLDVNALGEEMSIKDGKKVSIEFSINYYDENGNAQVQSRNDSTALWLIVQDAASFTQIIAAKIWTDPPFNVDHSTLIYENDTSSEQYGNGSWVKGQAHENSSFYFEFDSTNLLTAYTNGSTPSILHNGNADFLASRAEILQGIDKVKFLIKGNNGWDRECRVTIKAINGVSINERRALNDVNAHVNLGYKYTATTENEVTTYSNVDARIQAGVDSKIATIGANSSSDVKWGVEVSAEARTEKFANPTKVDEENNINYVVIGLGDIINNIDRAKVQFTVRPYISINGQVWYSASSKTYSVAEMVKVYYEEGSPVDGLYNIFTEKDVYVA